MIVSFMLNINFSCQENQIADEFLKNSCKDNSDWKSIWLFLMINIYCEYLNLPLIILHIFHQINKPLSQVLCISQHLRGYLNHRIHQNKTPSPFLERQLPFLLHIVLDRILRWDRDVLHSKKLIGGDYSRKNKCISVF